jgi:hypothetical protein
MPVRLPTELAHRLRHESDLLTRIRASVAAPPPADSDRPRSESDLSQSDSDSTRIPPLPPAGSGLKYR